LRLRAETVPYQSSTYAVRRQTRSKNIIQPSGKTERAAFTKFQIVRTE
jgi:hypothetical protein